MGSAAFRRALRRPIIRPQRCGVDAELGRFTAEYLALFRDFRQFRAGNRKGMFARGDGHPVIVLPGFLCCDPMTSHFRRLLEGLGYPTVGWDAGINLGPTAASMR
jgi:hypothetical protein